MKLQLHIVAVVFLLLKDFCPTNAMNAISLDSMESVISNLLRYTGKGTHHASCESSSGNITEMLEYIKMGEEGIEKTDIEDIVIVLGASGVGKSTLVQFVANETNSLRGNCTIHGCKIIDDSETIGDDIISKTFLPNLVFHNSTSTPFYDMPGFNDNRSPEMEVANGFFIQQVIRQAKRIKILILARWSSFTTSARQDFKMLLQNLADLLVTPEKFKGSMGIIATAVFSRNEEHYGLIEYLATFLNNDLLPALDNMFDGSEKYYVERSKIILQNIEPEAHLSYFLSPDKNGPILEEPRIFHNKERLDEVIYDNLQFIGKEDADFGLPLSEKALSVLKDTGYCISDKLAQQMKIFADDLKLTIKEGLSNVTNGNYEDLAFLSDLVTNLTNSNFSFNKPLSNYLDQLLYSISSLQISTVSSTEEQISSTMSFINFIEQTKATILYDPNSWVFPITISITELNAEYITAATAVSDKLVEQMKNFALDLKSTILEGMSNLVNGRDEDFDNLSELVSDLTSINLDFDRPLSNYLAQLLESISIFNVSTLEETKHHIFNAASFIKIIEQTKLTIPFDPVALVSPITTSISEIKTECSKYTEEISVRIKSELDRFSLSIEVDFIEKFKRISDGDSSVVIENFENILGLMVKADYSFLNRTGEVYSFYIDKVKETILSYGGIEAEISVKNLEHSEKVLMILEKLFDNINVYPMSWINLVSIRTNVVDGVTTYAEKIQGLIYWKLVSISQVIPVRNLEAISSLEDISFKIANSSLLATSLKTASGSIQGQEITSQNLTQFVKFYLSVVDEFTPDCSSCVSIPDLEALRVFEVLGDFGWRETYWTSSFVAILDPIENERDLSIFLRALFNDLSLPLFQTGEKSEMQSWWEVQREINERNFESFFGQISVQGFQAHIIFSRDRVKKFVLYKAEGRKRLNNLLDLMFQDSYGLCSTSTDVVIAGLIVSFDRALRCIKERRRTSVTFIATHQMFANARIIGEEINNVNNIHVIVMTNKILVSSEGQISLSGHAGVKEGEFGGIAGTQYALYKEMYPTASTIFSPHMTGGSGGPGYIGRQGAEGARGKQDFNENLHCAAWAGGKIQIRNFENNCNSKTTIDAPPNQDEYCHAGDNGILVEIYGRDGSKGGTGGPGSKGYRGGCGGQSYSIQADKFQSSKVPKNGASGKGGVGGPGGPGGIGGYKGDTVKMIIDDWGSPRRCVRLALGPRNPSYERGPRGNTGPWGPDGDSPNCHNTVDSPAVNAMFASLKLSLELQASSEFLHLQSKAFLESIKVGTPL